MAKIVKLKRGSIKVNTFLSFNPRTHPKGYAYVLENADKSRFARSIVDAIEFSIGKVKLVADEDDVDLSGLGEQL